MTSSGAAFFHEIVATECSDPLCTIPTVQACEAAAAFLGSGDVVATEQNKTSKPAGCWVTGNGRLNFNVGEGAPTSSEKLFCQLCESTLSPLTATTLTQDSTFAITSREPPYMVAVSNSCMPHCQLSSPDECSAAATWLLDGGEQHVFVQNKSSKPPGCWVTNAGRLQFNLGGENSQDVELLLCSMCSERATTTVAVGLNSTVTRSYDPSSAPVSQPATTARTFSAGVSAISGTQFELYFGFACADAQLCALSSADRCEQGATQLAQPDATVTQQQKANKPVGCWVTAAGRLQFNTATHALSTSQESLICATCAPATPTWTSAVNRLQTQPLTSTDGVSVSTETSRGVTSPVETSPSTLPGANTTTDQAALPPTSNTATLTQSIDTPAVPATRVSTTLSHSDITSSNDYSDAFSTSVSTPVFSTADSDLLDGASAVSAAMNAIFNDESMLLAFVEMSSLRTVSSIVLDAQPQVYYLGTVPTAYPSTAQGVVQATLRVEGLDLDGITNAAVQDLRGVFSQLLNVPISSVIIVGICDSDDPSRCVDDADLMLRRRLQVSDIRITVGVLLGQCPVAGDEDSDGFCSDVDSCVYDADNDADSDSICALDVACSDDSVEASPHGACSTYASGRTNSGFCSADDVCGKCPCSCGHECRAFDTCPFDDQNDIDSDSVCGDVDSCPFDAINDADSDGVCGFTACLPNLDFIGIHGACASYAQGRYNHGQCVSDGVCSICECECGAECGIVDLCPFDSQNDADSDDLCANDDACPFDANNDIDSDGVCDETACGVDDPVHESQHGNCRSYASGRANSGHCVEDGMCGPCPCACAIECREVDPCPQDSMDDADSDGICGTLSSNGLTVADFVEANTIVVVISSCVVGLIVIALVVVAICCCCKNANAVSKRVQQTTYASGEGVEMLDIRKNSRHGRRPMPRLRDDHYKIRNDSSTPGGELVVYTGGQERVSSSPKNSENILDQDTAATRRILERHSVDAGSVSDEDYMSASEFGSADSETGRQSAQNNPISVAQGQPTPAKHAPRQTRRRRARRRGREVIVSPVGPRASASTSVPRSPGAASASHRGRPVSRSASRSLSPQHQRNWNGEATRRTNTMSSPMSLDDHEAFPSIDPLNLVDEARSPAANLPHHRVRSPQYAPGPYMHSNSSINNLGHPYDDRTQDLSDWNSPRSADFAGGLAPPHYDQQLHSAQRTPVPAYQAQNNNPSPRHAQFDFPHSYQSTPYDSVHTLD